jgi:hypothetical protein
MVSMIAVAANPAGNSETGETSCSKCILGNICPAGFGALAMTVNPPAATAPGWGCDKCWASVSGDKTLSVLVAAAKQILLGVRNFLIAESCTGCAGSRQSRRQQVGLEKVDQIADQTGPKTPQK